MQMLAIPPEMPAVTPPEPAREMPEAIPDAVAPPEPAEATPEVVPEAVATPEKAGTKAVRGPTRWDYTTVTKLSKLIVELEWALLNETLPPAGRFDPLTATDEEIKAYLVLNPRFGRPPPRRTGLPATR